MSIGAFLVGVYVVFELLMRNRARHEQCYQDFGMYMEG